MASGQKIVEITTMLLLLSKVAKNSEAVGSYYFHSCMVFDRSRNTKITAFSK